MMNTMDLRAAKAVMSLRLEQARREAESHALRSQAPSQARGWFSQRGCWLLCQTGWLLVSWGERLKAYEPQRMRPAEGGLGGD